MSTDLFSRLTADRLEELAERQERVIGFLAAHGYNDEYLMNFVNAAAVLRALAGAERATESKDWNQRCYVLGVPSGPTLISALASVAKQEEQT